MRSLPAARRTLSALLLVVALLAVPPASTAALDGALGPTAGTAGQLDGGPANESSNATLDGAGQTIAIHVASDGSARIELVWTVPIEDEIDRAAFERLGTAFEDGELEPSTAYATFERIVDAVDRETQRRHTLGEPSRAATIANDTGRLTLSFVWRGFARVNGSEVRVDDAFGYGDGTWLGSLEAGQRLEIHAPDGYAVDRSPTSVVDGTVAWEGPRTFDVGEIALTYVPRDDPGPPNGGSWLGESSEAILTLTVVLALASVGSLLVLVVVLLRRTGRGREVLRDVGPAGLGALTRDGGGGSGDDVGRSSADSGAGAGTVTCTAGGNEGGPTATPVGSGEGTSGAGAGTEAGGQAGAGTPGPDPDPDDPFAGIDPDLLSDEERVVRLLRANDGRMKQATIVKETRWSNAKVSQLLSSMAEEGTIEKLRIGRENLITLIEDGSDGG